MHELNRGKNIKERPLANEEVKNQTLIEEIYPVVLYKHVFQNQEKTDSTFAYSAY